MSATCKIDKTTTWYKNGYWKREPLKNPDAEKLAQKIATYLPDVDKLQVALKAGEVKFPSGIVRFEVTAINDRSWSIYLEAESQG